MYKGPTRWQAARAIACLPALTGNPASPALDFVPSRLELARVTDWPASRPTIGDRPAIYSCDQMPRITDALDDRSIAPALFGTNWFHRSRTRTGRRGTSPL
jgi:hypothetical protein